MPDGPSDAFGFQHPQEKRLIERLPILGAKKKRFHVSLDLIPGNGLTRDATSFLQFASVTFGPA